MISRKSNFKIIFVIFIAALLPWLFHELKAHQENYIFLYFIYALLFVYITAHKQIKGNNIYIVYCFLKIWKYDITETIEISLQEGTNRYRGKGTTFWYYVKSINKKKCIFSIGDTNLGEIFNYIVHNSKHEVWLDGPASGEIRNLKNIKH
jgi:hypothetical protein